MSARTLVLAVWLFFLRASLWEDMLSELRLSEYIRVDEVKDDRRPERGRLRRRLHTSVKCAKQSPAQSEITARPR